MTRDKELEGFKAINLTEYAASIGYVLDKKRSSQTSVVMKSGSDKIVIAIDDTDKHWIFFTVGNSSENGSIIDFVQKCKGGSLGSVRQELRPWVGKSNISKSPISTYVPTLKPITKDKTQVIANFEAMKPVSSHRYLEQERLIPSKILLNSRFLGKVFEDNRDNAIFPHHDKDGLCGFELRNKTFKGFSKGGSKGLWFSAANKQDKRLVIAESAIKALSYHILFPDEQTRYASTAGKMNDIQPDLIRSAIGKLPKDGEVIIATDADKGGRDLAEELKIIVQSCSTLSIKIDSPKKEGLDWNDVLVQRHSQQNIGINRP